MWSACQSPWQELQLLHQVPWPTIVQDSLSELASRCIACYSPAIAAIV